MEQSATYQAIVRKSRAEEARRMLLLLGEKQFGPATATARAAIEGMNDVAQLEDLAVRLMSAASWQELLPTPARRRNGRRKTQS